MTQPIIVPEKQARGEGQPPIAATGGSFDIHEWSGSGPDYLHVHYADDEAWHILEGTLTFRFRDRTIQAPAGTTVFVPAGVAHTYYEAAGPTRYLIIMTPRLRELIAALHRVPRHEHQAVLHQFASEMVEQASVSGMSADVPSWAGTHVLIINTQSGYVICLYPSTPDA